MTDMQKKLIEQARFLQKYCQKKKICQNCDFRRYAPDHRDCSVGEPVTWGLPNEGEA